MLRETIDREAPLLCMSVNIFIPVILPVFKLQTMLLVLNNKLSIYKFISQDFFNIEL